jgi:hypothetical protein
MPSTPTGVVTSYASGRNAREVAAKLRRDLGERNLSLVFAFFTAGYDASALAEALSQALAPIPVVGCRGPGVIYPDNGYCEDGVVAVGFDAQWFDASYCPIFNLADFRMSDGEKIPKRVINALSNSTPDWSENSTFGVLFVDGLANKEEHLITSMNSAMPSIPLIGGSAGDALEFRHGHVICDGKAFTDAAVLVMIHSRRPYAVFCSNHFEPTAAKFVVTEADPERRIVRELNALPAAQVYADAVGLTGPLSQMSFAAHPVVVRVGGKYYVRSIKRVYPDNSLEFLCAIDEGIVLTLAHGKNMVDYLHRLMNEISGKIGTPEVILGFDCALRKLEAESRQMRREIEDVFKKSNIVGFSTFGEQYRAMHLNQTFTGVAIGAAK